MSRVLSISQVPTLRELYQRGTIAASSQGTHYPPTAALLDRVSVHKGDLTKLEVDAIVNAANRTLLGGGGVDGAIHRAAGKGLVEECATLNGCDTGDAKITKGYRLPARHVIHTVGPVFSKPDEAVVASLLASCYRRSLEVAVSRSLKSIAFPCISTGVYGYPNEDAAHVALSEVRQYLESEGGHTIERVVFVVFLPEDLDIYETLVPLYFPLDESSVTEV